jgi:phosphohistidine phosphatase
MLLYLVRHGIAIDREDPACPPNDRDRALTKEGKDLTRAAMLGLRELGIQPRTLLSSPYLRALETARICAESLGFPLDKIIETSALEPESPPQALFDKLGEVDAKAVLCTGHAPNMDDIIAYAVGAPAAFTALKKGGTACLELESLRRPRATLLWLHPPKVLRRLG